MRKRQVGSAAGWMFIVLVFGGALTIGLQLVPLYLDHNTMSKILDSMAEEDGLANTKSTKIQQIITQKFKMNNIRGFPIKENIEIKRTPNGVEIILDYEVRTTLIKNLDLVASFDKTVGLRK